MTTIYRSSHDEPPFGHGDFWTMRPESAEFVAQLDAGTTILPAQALHHYAVVVGDRVVDQPIDDLLPVLEGKPQADALAMLRGALLERGEKLAEAGYAWVQFTERGESWNGAMLYVGDEPVHSRIYPAAQG